MGNFPPGASFGRIAPLVSIVIPVYNGENFLRQAVYSALAQTYKPIEIIIVNDGSTDGTDAIARSYGGAVRYFAKKNGGTASALNFGVSRMRGEFFQWLSHDDLYAPEKTEREMAALLCGAGLSAAAAYCDYAVINAEGRRIASLNIARRFPGAPLTKGLFPVLRQALGGCCLLIRKSALAGAGPFDEGLPATHDYALWFKIFRGQNLAYVNETLVLQREHGAQFTRRASRAEADALWLGMLSALTAGEAAALGGTERSFWSAQTDFLCCTPHKGALAFAKGRLRAAGGRRPSARRLARRAAYKALSGAAALARAAGLQEKFMRGPLFGRMYRAWFEVRYR